jgi:thiol-disulfide isomerase/thioredoxin
VLVATSLALVLIAAPPVLTPMDPKTVGTSLAPNLRATKGSVLLTWLERVEGPAKTSTHRLRISTLTYRAWSEPVTIHESPDILASWADVPSVNAADDGTLLAHWAEKTGAAPHAYDVILGRSNDGRTWTRIGAAHDDKTETEHGFVSMTPAKGSGVRVFWLDGRESAGGKGGPTALRSAVFRDRTQSSDVIDPRVCDCCGTGAAMTQDGPVVVYRDRDEDEIRDISLIRQLGDRWTAPISVSRDGWKIAGCPVNGPSVDARARRVAVAWFTVARTPEVRAAFSEDGGATFGAPIRVDDGTKAAPLGRVDVVLTDGGDAIVTWLEGVDDVAARVRARRVSADRRRGAALDVVSTVAARASGFPQIVRRKDELVVAWTEVGPPTRVRVATLALSAVPAMGRDQEPIVVSGDADDVSAYRAQDLAGRPVGVASLSGKATLINVWASWCLPCREEVPVLNALHAKYGKRGLAVVGVSVDEAGARSDVDRIVRDAKMSYSVWLDPDNKAQTALGASALPITLLVDRAGRVLWRFEGKLAADSVEAQAAIEHALAEGPR